MGANKRDSPATGFFGLGPTYRSDGGDPDSVAQAKGETLDDRVDSLSRGFLALTVSCARCHDHKFDPIPQQDYYSIAGIFNNTRPNEIPLDAKDVVENYKVHQRAITNLNQRIKNLQKKAKQQPPLTNDQQKQLNEWNSELKRLKATAPPKFQFAHGLADSGAADMRVALRGNLRKPGDVAPRRFLRILAGSDPPRFQQGSGRIELAQAIATNPLTARVFVNRVWMHHFGKALVRSPSNFGVLGETPTHPRLLEWLAGQFMESGWSIKQLHRTIMLSATYQMSSRFDDHNFSVDGDNRLIWRMNSRRLDVESWRDSLLFVTGELDQATGGQPVEDITRSLRRTLYAKVSRNGDRFASDQFLRMFDFPLMRASVAQRSTSIVPQQYLFLMNSSFLVERAKALAIRLARVSGRDLERIRQAYQLLYSRTASDEETTLGLQYLSTAAPVIRESSAAGVKELTRWVQYAQVLLSSNEFMYVR